MAPRLVLARIASLGDASDDDAEDDAGSYDDDDDSDDGGGSDDYTGATDGDGSSSTGLTFDSDAATQAVAETSVQTALESLPIFGPLAASYYLSEAASPLIQNAAQQLQQAGALPVPQHALWVTALSALWGVSPTTVKIITGGIVIAGLGVAGVMLFELPELVALAEVAKSKKSTNIVE